MQSINTASDKQISLLLREGSLASTSIGYGLTLLRKFDICNKGNFYQSLFQLSIGMERLMKLIMISKYRVEYNRFPNNDTLKTYGHKLIKLYEVVSSYFVGNYPDPCQGPICSSILNLFSDYAMSSRYYNLDVLTNRDLRIADPLVAWKQIQDEIIKLHPVKSRQNITKKSFLDFIDKNSMTVIYNEDNEVISNFSELHNNVVESEHIQGYAVMYTLKIIGYLVNILDQIETEGMLYPYLIEFFYNFCCSNRTPSEIRKKRNWAIV